MGFIHVPAGEDARFFPEGANQSGIAFEIHHTDFTLTGQAQILPGDVHNDSEPFLVPIVPEHKKTGILGEEMLAICAVDFRYVGFQFASVHGVLFPSSAYHLLTQRKGLLLILREHGFMALFLMLGIEHGPVIAAVVLDLQGVGAN